MSSPKKKSNFRKSTSAKSLLKKTVKKIVKKAKKVTGTKNVAKKTSRKKEAEKKIAPSTEEFSIVKKGKSKKTLTAEGWKRLMMGAKN